jgi:hypothetical protein
VTLHLGRTHPAVNVYDPTIGTTPAQVNRGIDSLVLNLSDHPIVIEVRTGQ